MAVRITIYDDVLKREAYRTTVGQRTDIAQEIANESIATAPVLHGDYRGGIGVEVSGDVVTVRDTDPDAFYKEYGTVDTEAHATLTDAARKRGKYTGLQPGHR